ncbi:YciI family protein [Pontibacter sp. SGAir0037]|uniref:YciI family protein n=1 Tax=Pontibacter sp. SGAir0037 TaxID=2571030 RepID=UPI0010CD5151|nr:YciI family protein [Pontibacter sp. SGAir0037]QCR24352.1 transcription initiation protein [Pontibacter sp. SGAir0037]
MKQYMIFLKEDLQAAQQLAPEQMEADIQQYMQWVEELTQAGQFVAGDPLESGGYHITQKELLTDGPFIESKEAISGYFIIKAASDEQAIEIARQCPVFKAGGSVELRPVMQY